MSDLEQVFRIALAVLFGMVVGVERQWHHKNAGIKTTTLASLGAAAFSGLSTEWMGLNSNPTQIAAAVVTGIGFIGGGVIMRRGGSVQGVNTAATLWATASMGLAVGSGHYRLGTIVFVSILVVQFVTRAIAIRIDRRASNRAASQPHLLFEIEAEAPSEAAVDTIDAAWSRFGALPGVTTNRRAIQRSGSGLIWRGSFDTAAEPVSDLPRLEHEILAVDGVTRVESRRVTMDEEAPVF
ncbi:MAG TPA: MgtC/SapB family protein [Thermoanaerobaculia bacterium]|nr:MgtC/SapB family protein [Thermoanaerobaculia bacterium]